MTVKELISEFNKLIESGKVDGDAYVVTQHDTGMGCYNIREVFLTGNDNEIEIY